MYTAHSSRLSLAFLRVSSFEEGHQQQPSTHTASCSRGFISDQFNTLFLVYIYYYWQILRNSGVRSSCCEAVSWALLTTKHLRNTYACFHDNVVRRMEWTFPGVTDHRLQILLYTSYILGVHSSYYVNRLFRRGAGVDGHDTKKFVSNVQCGMPHGTWRISRMPQRGPPLTLLLPGELLQFHGYTSH